VGFSPGCSGPIQKLYRAVPQLAQRLRFLQAEANLAYGGDRQGVEPT
jgi:hypothetical protein